MNLMHATDLPTLQAELTRYMNDATIDVDEMFSKRIHFADLLEWIDQLASTHKRDLAWSKIQQIAHSQRQQVQLIDKAFFVRLRRQIREEALRGSALRAYLNSFTSYVAGAKNVNYWQSEALDLLWRGIVQASSPPQASQALAAEMVHLEHTPTSLLLELVDRAGLHPASVFYDLGSGLGQVTILIHLLTQAQTIGIEFEPRFVAYAQACATGLGLASVEFINADVRAVDLDKGDCFFMFTPFRGKILQSVLKQLQQVAQQHPITLCTYGPCTPIVAQQPWLHNQDGNAGHEFRLALFRSWESRE